MLTLTLVKNLRLCLQFGTSVHFDPGIPSFFHSVKMTLKSSCLSVYLDIVCLHSKETFCKLLCISSGMQSHKRRMMQVVILGEESENVIHILVLYLLLLSDIDGVFICLRLQTVLQILVYQLTRVKQDHFSLFLSWKLLALQQDSRLRIDYFQKNSEKLYSELLKAWH